MAMLMAMSYKLSNSNERYTEYVFKRFNRLIVPALKFITFFIIAMLVLNILGLTDYDLNLKKIFLTYTFISGIGYVWIIRVFFIIALILPFIDCVYNKSDTTFKKIFILVILFLSNSIIDLIGSKLIINNHINLLYTQFVAIMIGYSILAYVGIIVIRNSIKDNIMFFCVFLFLFILEGYRLGFPLLSDNKYPPTNYFLFYGIVASLVLFILTSFKHVEIYLTKFKFFTYFSKYSLNMYYWHIFPITIMDLTIPQSGWHVRYLIAVAVSIVLTKIQVKYFPKFF